MSAHADGEPAPLSGARLAVAAVAISLGFFLVILDITIANVSVPHIAGSLGVSSTQGTWIITSYAVAEAICLPLTGWFARRLGTLRTYTTGLIGFMIASALCGLSTSLSMLVACRVAQGICGAPLLPLCQTLLLRIFPKEMSGIAIGIAAMTAVMAPLSGPILGGFITDNFSWRWIFYLNIPVVLICVPLVTRLLGRFETARTIEKIDLVGLTLLVVWVGALQLLLDLGRERDWFASTLIIMLAIVSAVGLLAFLAWELTEERPIVDLRIMRHRGFWTSTLCISIGYAAFMVTVVMVPLWTQTSMGYTATAAGYALAPISFFSLFCIPLAGRLATTIDTRIMIFGALCWLGAVSLIRARATPTMDLYSIALPQLLQGLSSAFYMLGLTVIALGSVQPREVASAAGLLAFTRTMATAIAISWATTAWEDQGQIVRAQLVGTLRGADGAIAKLTETGLTKLQARAMIERMVEVQSSTISFDHIFAATGLLCLIAAALVWLIPKPHRPKVSTSA